MRSAKRSQPFEKANPLQVKRHAHIARIIRQNGSPIRKRKRPRHLRERDIRKIKRNRPR